MHLRTFALFFTEKGQRRFSPEQRVAIGKQVRKSLQANFLNKPGYKKRHQLFPKFGDGGLGNDDMKDVKTAYETNNTTVDKPILISTIRVGDVSEFQNALSEYKNIKVEEGDVKDVFHGNPKEEGYPDIFIGGPDVSFMEDVGLISYTVNAGLIGVPKSSRADWLTSYMNMQSKSDRINALKQVHKNALLNAIVVPFASSPYVALLRDGWKSELPEIIANNLLWKIRKN